MPNSLFSHIFDLDDIYLKDSFTGQMQGPYRGSTNSSSGGPTYYNAYLPDPFSPDAFVGPLESASIEATPYSNVLTGCIVICFVWLILSIWLPIQALRWTMHFLYARKHHLIKGMWKFGFLSVMMWLLCLANLYLIGEVSGYNRIYIHQPLYQHRMLVMTEKLSKEITMTAILPECAYNNPKCFNGNLFVEIKNNSHYKLNITGSWFDPKYNFDKSCLFEYTENTSPHIVPHGGVLRLNCKLTVPALERFKQNGTGSLPIYGMLWLRDVSTNVMVEVSNEIKIVR